MVNISGFECGIGMNIVGLTLWEAFFLMPDVCYKL